jgi:branched-chain amino acid transport system substrate-binding protein
MFGAASQSVIPKVFDEVDGLKMAGTIHGFPWWSTAAPVQKYLGVMKGYLSKSDYDGQTYANTSATNVWTSLELFRKVNTKLSDTPTRAEVTSAYHTVKDETLDGLLPQPISYPDGKPTPPINCFWSWKYTDKKFTTVEPEGKSGNGQTGDLATSCFPLSK